MECGLMALESSWNYAVGVFQGYMRLLDMHVWVVNSLAVFRCLRPLHLEDVGIYLVRYF